MVHVALCTGSVFYHPEELLLHSKETLQCYTVIPEPSAELILSELYLEEFSCTTLDVLH